MASAGVGGEVYGLEREASQQRSIMRYNLQTLGGPEHLEELVARFLDGLFYHMPHEATKAGYHKYVIYDTGRVCTTA